MEKHLTARSKVDLGLTTLALIGLFLLAAYIDHPEYFA